MYYWHIFPFSISKQFERSGQHSTKPELISTTLFAADYNNLRNRWTLAFSTAMPTNTFDSLMYLIIFLIFWRVGFFFHFEDFSCQQCLHQGLHLFYFHKTLNIKLHVIFTERVSYFIIDTGCCLRRERQLQPGPPCISDKKGKQVF